MFLLPHIWLFVSLLIYYLSENNSNSVFLLLIGAFTFLIYAIFSVYLHIMPFRVRGTSALRLSVLGGGRKLLRLCGCGILFQFAFYLLLLLPGQIISFLQINYGNTIMLVADVIICILHYYLLLVNACIRILCCCQRLGIIKRLLILFWLWIPLLNLFLLYYLSQKAKEEIDQEICRFENQQKRDGRQTCATKYPLILLHGIGFRDVKYFNYWGRIPRELVKNGATVYYGHQQAWGTIEDNALIIKDKIEEVLKENNCEKVNIIAHSKGGLDARYLISALHMEDKVASLTTIATPHHGSELLQFLNRLPDALYRKIASGFDKSFSRFGDIAPDCYHASKQLSPAFCKEFNEKYPDKPGVYYQSYAASMGSVFSDSLLSLPCLLMSLTGARPNDGLVCVTSAKWGDFQETFTSSHLRGISHGDLIDLKREDYKGFDVLEAYIRIVARLKELGY